MTSWEGTPISHTSDESLRTIFFFILWIIFFYFLFLLSFVLDRPTIVKVQRMKYKLIILVDEGNLFSEAIMHDFLVKLS